MADRRCDRCGIRMPRGVARYRRGDDLICEGCAHGREGRPLTGSKMEYVKMPDVDKPTMAGAPFIKIEGALVKVAHQSNDGVTIYHCPFCGGGQVVAGGDGTISCEFCHTSFLVQVQPQQATIPQNINGVPYQAPGMPPPGSAPTPTESQPQQGGEKDDSASFGGDNLGDKPHDGQDALSQSGGGDDKSSSNFPPKKDNGDSDGSSSGGNDKPPWLKNKAATLANKDYDRGYSTAEGHELASDEDMANEKFAEGYKDGQREFGGPHRTGMYITQAGVALDEESFIKHIALATSPNWAETLKEVRAHNWAADDEDGEDHDMEQDDKDYDREEKAWRD